MSLVNEALKKARLEAARQDALQRGRPLPPPTFLTPRRHRSIWPSVAAAAAALLALGAVGFWLGQRAGRTDFAPVAAEQTVEAGETPPSEAVAGPADGTSSAPADSPPAAEAETQIAASEPSAPPVTTAPPEPVAVREPAPSRASSQLAAPDRSPRSSADIAATPPASRPQAAPSRPPQAAPASGPIYVEVAELPGGRLELGGIAWSRTDPHALINGRIVGVGERVELYTVIDIQPREVELTGDLGSFILRLP